MTAKRLGFAVFLMAALWSMAGLPWTAPSSTTMMPSGVSVAFADDSGAVEGDPDEYNGGEGVEGDPDEFVEGGENAARHEPTTHEVKVVFKVEVLVGMASSLLNSIAGALF